MIPLPPVQLPLSLPPIGRGPLFLCPHSMHAWIATLPAERQVAVLRAWEDLLAKLWLMYPEPNRYKPALN